jgi:hypothetical protein
VGHLNQRPWLCCGGLRSPAIKFIINSKLRFIMKNSFYTRKVEILDISTCKNPDYNIVTIDPVKDADGDLDFSTTRQPILCSFVEKYKLKVGMKITLSFRSAEE